MGQAPEILFYKLERLGNRLTLIFIYIGHSGGNLFPQSPNKEVSSRMTKDSVKWPNRN